MCLARPAGAGTWRGPLKSPPGDGKGNAELIELGGLRCGCAKSAVAIKTGAGSKPKRVITPD